jgi:Flp pilus assembly protein TadD
MLAWSGADAWRTWPRARPVLAGLCGVAGVALVMLTVRQISYWENSVALFQHAIEVTGPNPIAHGLLANEWTEQVMYDEAISEYRKGLAIAPHNSALLGNLGELLIRAGRPGEAIAPLTEAVRLLPGEPILRNDLGVALHRSGRIDEAIAQFSESLRMRPDNAVTRQNLQAALAMKEGTDKK